MPSVVFKKLLKIAKFKEKTQLFCMFITITEQWKLIIL